MKRISTEAPTQREADKRDAWRRYVAGGRRDQTLRNALLELEQTRLRQLARSVGSRLAGAVEWQDLVQDGALGLLGAAGRYDPDSDTTFWTFASIRARGAMLDGLRTRDPESRQCRSRAAQRKACVEQFRAGQGRLPSPEQVQELLGWTPQQYAQSFPRNAVSLSTPTGENPTRVVELGDLLCDQACDLPGSHLEHEQSFRELLKGLAFDDQVMLWLYYAREAKMKDLGVVLGVSESWVSQRIAAAKDQLLARLRREMAS
jgi:RNA polymerase sigma factor for flagellar operon FliA